MTHRLLTFPLTDIIIQPIHISIMSDTPTTLQRLAELKKEWRDNNFSLTPEQQEAYNVLLAHRKARVSQLIKDGRVWVGPSEAGKPLAE